MDAGTAAVLVAIITGVVAIAASVVGPFVGSELARRRDREIRLRTLRLEQLGQAERSMVLQLDGTMAIAENNMGQADRLLADLRGLGYADPRLVGDVEVARAWASSCAQVLVRLPKHPAAGLQVGLLGVRATPAEKAALAAAKTRVLAAFDKQRERVVQDLGPVVLDSQQMEEMLGTLAEVQSLLTRTAEPTPPTT